MTKIVQFEETADPAAVVDSALVYSKDVAGLTQLFCRISDGTVYQLTPTVVDKAGIIAFGNNSLAAAAGTRFLDQWSSTTTAGTAEADPIVMPRAGTLRNLFVSHQAAVGNGNSIVYTVRVNGVNTTLTVTLASGAIAQASDLVNTVAVAQGDRVTLSAVKALALGNGAVIPSVTMELV